MRHVGPTAGSRQEIVPSAPAPWWSRLRRATTSAALTLLIGGLAGGVVRLLMRAAAAGLLVLVVTPLLHLSQIVVVGLDEGAAALIENLSPLTAVITAAFLIAPPLAASASGT